MKKLIVFVLLLCCLATTGFVKVDKNPLWQMTNVEKVCFVCDSDYKSDKIDSVACGDMFFNYCSLNVAKDNMQMLKKDMSAVQFYLKNQDLKALQEKLKYKHISQTTLENLTVYCGYSPYGQDGVYVDGQKANIQIAVEKDLIIVGFPLILTGY